MIRGVSDTIREYSREARAFISRVNLLACYEEIVLVQRHFKDTAITICEAQSDCQGAIVPRDEVFHFIAAFLNTACRIVVT